jgi:maltose alpha-D-glucosyltransferase/alpha-amylase
MQWTPDRNAGFSTADPGKLFLPAVQSLAHHYSAVNVEAQLAQSSSLLHWLRGMLGVRKQHPVFGLGSYVPLASDNDAVLSFLRVLDASTPGGAGQRAETVLCVANLSPTPQSVTTTLPDHAGARTEDLFGGGRFPSVGDDGTVTLTLGSRTFFWLTVVPTT